MTWCWPELPSHSYAKSSFTNRQVDSNCNSILKPADSNGVTMELKIKVENIYEPLMPCLYYNSVPTFVSDRPSVSIKLLINQYDCFIEKQLQCSSSKSNTPRSVPEIHNSLKFL